MSSPSPKRTTNLRKGAEGRAVHDLGGMPDLSPIDRSEHEPNLYEKRVDALVNLLRDNKRRVFSVDALRRVIESYAEQQYDATGYSDRWIRAVRNLVLEQELITREELDERIAQVRKELAAEGRKVSRRKVP